MHSHSSTVGSRQSLPTLALLIAISGLLFAAAALAVPPPLPDQYGNEAGMDKFKGEPVVVYVTSLTELPNLGKWEEAIRPQVPNMNSMDIGDIDTTSGMTVGLVKRELKKHVPDGVSVYIDEENLWAKEYDLNLDDPNILFFDESHTLVKTLSGKPKDDELLKEVIAEAKKMFPESEETG